MRYQVQHLDGELIGSPHPTKEEALAHAANVLGVRAVFEETVGLSTYCYMTKAQRGARKGGLLIVGSL